jgi:hypothetical protein
MGLLHVTIHLLDLDGQSSHLLHPRFHLPRSGLLPPNIDIDAISEALSDLHLGTNEGQAPENGRPGSSQGQMTPTDKPQDHGRTRG